MAEQTASAFPDLDDPSELAGADETTTADGSVEDDDKTVVAAPAAKAQGKAAQSKDQVKDQGKDAGKGKGDTEAELPVDGDETVLVAPSDLPAGTEHLTDKGGR